MITNTRLLILYYAKDGVYTANQIRQMMIPFIGRKISTGTLYPIVQKLERAKLILRTDNKISITKLGKTEYLYYKNKFSEEFERMLNIRGLVYE